MKPTNAWNFLVQQHNSKFAVPESVIQSDWENYFADGELFGYSRILGEVDAHRKLHLGSSDREIPDIILRKDGNDLFIVELKQYSLAKNADFEKQLLNYMAHTDLRLSVGVLVCSKIYLYFYNVAENTKIYLEIPFTSDNPDGIKFVELFSKSNFDLDKIKDFIKSRNQEQNNIQKVTQELKAPDLIPTLLKKYFAEKGLEKEFDEIKENYKFSCAENTTHQESNLENPQQNFSYSASQNYRNNGNAPEVVLKIGEREVSSAEFKQKLLQTKQANRTWIYSGGRTEKDVWLAYSFRPDSNLLGNIHSTKYRNWKTSGLVKLICTISE